MKLNILAVLELVFELIMTLSNVRATNFFNKTSPEHSKFEAESQLAVSGLFEQIHNLLCFTL